MSLVIIGSIGIFQSANDYYNSKPTSSQERITELEYAISIDIMHLKIQQSNHEFLEALDGSSKEDIFDHLDEAITCLKDAREEANVFLPKGNDFEETIDLLIDNYKKTKKYLNSSKRDEKFIKILVEGTSMHDVLLVSSNCYASLYEIRMFDKLSDVEAKKQLSKSWDLFRFEEDCPKSISKDEIFYLWGSKYVDDSNMKSFKTKVEALRKNDNLINKKVNQKWLDFVGKFISMEKTRNISESFSLYKTFVCYI